VGAVIKDVVVMAGPIKNLVYDVGTGSLNTSPRSIKNRLTVETANKKATHDLLTASGFAM
jgi:hypothetical protein